jgi:hypothetical protein
MEDERQWNSELGIRNVEKKVGDAPFFGGLKAKRSSRLKANKLKASKMV